MKSSKQFTECFIDAGVSLQQGGGGNPPPPIFENFVFFARQFSKFSETVRNLSKNRKKFLIPPQYSEILFFCSLIFEIFRKIVKIFNTPPPPIFSTSRHPCIYVSNSFVRNLKRVSRSTFFVFCVSRSS